MADHTHLWTDFNGESPPGQPWRSCIVCGKKQTWDECFEDDGEAGLWFNHRTKRLEDRPFAIASE